MFAGQGAQTVGMGRDLAERFDSVRELFDRADAQLGYALTQKMFDVKEEELTRTLVQQGLQRLPTLLALQRTAAALEGQGEDLQGQLDRAAQTIAEARSTIWSRPRHWGRAARKSDTARRNCVGSRSGPG